MTNDERSDLERLCAARNVRAMVGIGSAPFPESWGTPKGKPGRSWRVHLKYQGRTMGPVDFFTGSGIMRKPGAADVLSCLISDAFAGEQTFADFCGDFGYDEDSRKAERTWKQCAAYAGHVRHLLGDDFEAFAEAEH